MVEGVGTRGGHSPRDLIMQTDDLLTWVPPSPTRVKKSSRRRAPDAERGCPPATEVDSVSSPSSPEAGAAPRRPSVGGQVGFGPSSSPAHAGADCSAWCGQGAMKVQTSLRRRRRRT